MFSNIVFGFFLWIII